MHELCSHLTRITSTVDVTEIAPVRCKRWSCPVCHELNRARVISLARAGKPRAMLTLTVRSTDYPSPDEAAEALKRGLRLLRLRLSRHPRFKNFEFLAVFERHKSGYPHMHLLIRGDYIPWKVLRGMWERITGSYQVDVRKIDTRGKAAFYVAKYIGKDLSSFEGCKRWWRSRNYNADEAEDYVPQWCRPRHEAWDTNFHALRFLLLYDGWNLERTARERWRIRPPPEPHLPLSAHIAEAARLGGGTGTAAPRGRR